jgi:hypothetical protein
MTPNNPPASRSRSLLLLLLLAGVMIVFGVIFAVMYQRQAAPSDMPPAVNWIAADGETQITLLPNALPQHYAFNASATQPTLMVLQPSPPDFAFAAQLTDDQGALVAQFDSRLQVAALALSPGSISYRLMVETVDPAAIGSVTVAIGAAAAARSSPPAAILSKAAPLCQLTSAEAAAIVRSAPSPEYAIIGTLNPDRFIPVLGQTDNGWYAVNFAERQGWLSAELASLVGSCVNLPRLLNPAIPAAPADPDVYLMEIDRDGSGQIRGSISTPNGDSSDVIWVRAINLDSNTPNNYREYTLTLNCTGASVESLRWGAPLDPNLACGDSVALPFLYQLNQQPIAVVIAPSSPQSYIEYMLTVTSSTAWQNAGLQMPAPAQIDETGAVG